MEKQDKRKLPENMIEVFDLIDEDLHPQPLDPAHEQGIRETCEHLLLINKIYEPFQFKTVLDLGCGQGLASKIFIDAGKECTGVTLADDKPCEGLENLEVIKKDIHFLELPDNSYDLIFARHIIEHSPIPMYMLFEMKRVSKNFIYMVVPECNWLGLQPKNHYAIFTPEMWEKLFERVGLKIVEKMIGKYHVHPKGIEYRYLLKSN